jgi:hypothetical protein
MGLSQVPAALRKENHQTRPAWVRYRLKKKKNLGKKQGLIEKSYYMQLSCSNSVFIIHSSQYEATVPSELQSNPTAKNNSHF